MRNDRARAEHGTGPEPGRTIARGLPVLVLVVLVVVVARVESVSSPLADAHWRALESEADTVARRACRDYREAFESWGRVRVLARRLGDPVVRLRASRRRAELAVAMLDPGLFEAEVSRSAPATPAKGPPRLAIRDPSAVELRELRHLAKLLSAARGAYAQLPGREARDLPLIYEALARVLRVAADTQQLRADVLYREALAAVKPSASVDARAVAAAVRVRFKLRDFSGAEKLSRAHESLLSKLDVDDQIDHLRCLRAIAIFSRIETRRLALSRRIRDLGGRAEQPPRPVARFPGLSVSRRADLARAATTLVRIVTHCELEPRGETVCAYFAALAALDLGEFALVEELLGRRELSVADDPWLRGSVLSRLGAARERLGDYEGAWTSFEDARRSIESLVGGEGFRARLTLGAASALVGLGRADDAIARARAVVRDSSLPLDSRLRARIVLASALYLRARSDPPRLEAALAAVRTCERELDSVAGRKLEGRSEIASSIAIHTANILRCKARSATKSDAAALLQEATRRQDIALRRANAGKDFVLAAVAASNLGELYLESGQLDVATGFVNWALEQARSDHQFETEWRCHWYLARIARARGDEAAADRGYAEASRIVDSYRSRILDAESKRGFMTDKLDLYRDMVDRELDRGRAARAFEVAERARARSLVESLGWRYVALADRSSRDLYREFISLAGRASSTRAGARELFLGLDRTATDHDRLRQRLNAVRDRIRASGRSNPLLRTLVDGDAATAGEISGQLAADTALIEYFSLGDALVAFVVEGGRVAAVRLDVRPDDLRTLARRFFASRASDSGIARRLYELLVAPLAGRVTRQRVVIVPCGELFRFPFEALRHPQGYLIERWTISYLPSASLVRFLHAAGGNEDEGSDRGQLDLLALADPDTDYDRDGRADKARLDHARQEVAAFSPRFRERTVLSGADARESSLVSMSRDRDVIHLACHGEFYPARPWDSTLFLAPGGEKVASASEDGRLRAIEIYGLDLRGSRLVVLSGCETARSQVAASDDPVGLGAAFLHSGASSLLASLWKVEDRATAELMKEFYEGWIGAGLDRAGALRRAKLSLIESGFTDPGQWAAFVYVGDR